MIIDEEHDGSYQSESNPRYNTLEVAKERAAYNKCALILGSATPSLESYYAAQRGEYKLLVLPEQPVKAAVIAESAITVAKNFFILISFPVALPLVL